MGLLTLEHGKTAYRIDLALYGVAVVALAVFLMAAGPAAQRLGLAAITCVGLASWPLIEYLLHRFVLHGLKPFSRWHAEHHQRPMALIYTPTVMSALLIAVLVFLPALLMGGLWVACALTLGILIGYLAYTLAHHATHNWRAEGAWLKKRKRWHALHHHNETVCYGVTSSVWDRALGTATQRTAATQR